MLIGLGLSSAAANAREAFIPPMSSGQLGSGYGPDSAQYQVYFQNYADYKSWETNASISLIQVWTMDQGLQWRILVTPKD
jgi:hypothetical protein